MGVAETTDNGDTVKLTVMVTAVPPVGESVIVPEYGVEEAERPEGLTFTVRLVGVLSDWLFVRAVPLTLAESHDWDVLYV